MNQLKAAFETVEHAYIADGHHRVASSLRMAEAHPDQKRSHAFMALLVSGGELMFRGFHRNVRMTDDQECKRVLATLPSLRGAHWIPGCNHTEPSEGSILLRGAINGELNVSEAIMDRGMTPAEWLQNDVLAPLFGIEEPRTDGRLEYIAGDIHQQALEDAAVARIMLAPGRYAFTRSMSGCNYQGTPLSAVCITRSVTIAAQARGTAVLNAHGSEHSPRVVLTVDCTACQVELVGLNLTGGCNSQQVRPASLGRRRSLSPSSAPERGRANL